VPETLVPEALAGAHAALAVNRRHGLTVPQAEMFPGGFLWDTAVIAKGIAVHDPGRAASDILRFLQSQWRGGMLPNEVYFEGMRFRRYAFGYHPDRPEGLTTSGITQPPMIVRAALEVGRRLEPEQRSSFFAAVFPALSRLCSWVLEERVGRNGLAVTIHPFETGMDNRIDLAEAMSEEWSAGGVLGEPLKLAAFTTLGVGRRLWGDGRRVPAEQRTSHRDLLNAFLQTRHIRRFGYDLAAVERSGRGVLIEDVGYNAVLVDAFASLHAMAADLGCPGEPRLTVPPAMTESMDRVAERLDDLWHDDPTGRDGGYYSRNYRTGQLLLRPTVAGLFPLLTTRQAGRVEVLVRTLVDPSKYWTRVAPPSAPVDSEGFTPNRYWRGPAWAFPVDIIETGLELQGLREVSAELRRKYLTRPHGRQHAEYENPLTGEPLGVNGFSPAAALTIRFAQAGSADAHLAARPRRVQGPENPP
jgi:hypothetical protein